MLEVWILGGAIILVIGLCAASVILTMTRKEESPLDKIFARQDKIEALVESAEIWAKIGSRHEVDACMSEVKRLNGEVVAIMQGENL